MSENKPATIENFPPQLQKIAAYLVLSDRKISIRQVCKKLDINYGSVRVQITEARKNGNDFNSLLGEHSLNWLKSKINEVDHRLLKKAISASETNPKYLELYYKRIGLLKESPQVNIDSRSLVVVSPPAVIPSTIAKSLPEENLEELEIEGPKPGK